MFVLFVFLLRWLVESARRASMRADDRKKLLAEEEAKDQEAWLRISGSDVE